jgi:hypothetical protein
MFHYRLRTLLTLLAAGPPLIASAWFYVENAGEFLGWLTFMGILSLAYWSIFNSHRYDPTNREPNDQFLDPPSTG